MPDVVRYTGTQEWSALFVNGQLDRIGDHYLIDERIAELAGIKVVDSDDFLLGGDGRQPAPAKTLDEVEEYRSARADWLERAETARREAAMLLEEAASIEKRYKR